MTYLMQLLRRFRRSERGALSVETVIMFPILLWAYGAMFVYWDIYKTLNMNLKATYTIADLISREPDPMTPAYIDGASGIYRYLLRSQDDGDIRVTVVSMDSDAVTGAPFLKFEWSYGTAGLPSRTDLTGIIGEIPIMALGDNLIIVESSVPWDPPMLFGLEPRQITNRVFTSPRFVPQVLCTGCA